MALLIFYILLLTVAFPLGQVIRVAPFQNIDITVLDIVVGIGMTLWLATTIARRKSLGSIWKPFCFFLGSLFVSLFLQILHLPFYQLGEGALYLLRYIVYGLLFFMTVTSSKRAKTLLSYFLLLGGGLLLLSGFVQFFLYPSLRNLIYAGWDEHFYRMFGTFLDPNYFGMFLVGYILLTLAFFLRQTKKNMKVFFATLVLITFIAIVLSYSRTALVALAVGLVVMFWRNVFSKKTAIGIALLILIAVSVMGLVGRRAVGNDLLRRTSTNARIGDAKNALVIFSQNVLTGVGFNTYRFAQYRYGFMKESQTVEDHGASGADSSLLFVMATSGVVGTGAFLYFLYSHAVQLQHQKEKLGFSTLLAFFAGSFFVNILFYPSLLVWLWVILGISESTSL